MQPAAEQEGAAGTHDSGGVASPVSAVSLCFRQAPARSPTLQMVP